MDGIIRKNLDDAFANECAYSEVVEAGDWVLFEFAHKGGENGLQVQIDAIAYKGK